MRLSTRPSWRRVSLQSRLVAAVALVLLLGLVGSGVAAESLVRSYLEDRVDQELVSTAERLQAPRRAAPVAPGEPFLPSRYAVALLAEDGQEVLRAVSGSGDDSQDLSFFGDDLADTGGRPVTRTADDGTQWRVLVTALPGGRAMAVATTLSEVRATTGRLRSVVLLVGIAVLGLGIAVGLALVRASLRPLRRIETSAGAIAEGDLSHRVPQEAAPSTEVGSLARSLNAMLGQIEEGFAVKEASEQRMRRFVADASHELRTPLTSIRGFAELHRQGAAREPEDVSRLMRRIEDESVRMSDLVEDLLLLARLDQQRPLHRDPVDLSVVAHDVVHDLRATAPGHTVTLETTDVEVLGDEARLRQVLINLVANAVRHTPRGTSVTVRVRRTPGAAVLEVTDDGPGIAPEDQDRIFDGFWRADSSRTRGAGGGAGLGLTIVDALVRAHGGTVEVESAPGRGATFRVRLPLT